VACRGAARWDRACISRSNTRKAQRASPTAQDAVAAIDLRFDQLAERCWRANPPVDVAKQRIAWTIVGQANFDPGRYGSRSGFQHALLVTERAAGAPI